MKRIICFIGICLGWILTSLGQGNGKGFNFFASAGIYEGNRYHATYYNGNNEDINIRRVLGNSILKNQIDRSVSEKNGIILDEKGIILDELPASMHYNWSFSLNLGAAYRLNEEFSLIATVGQVKLTAHSQAVFTYHKGVSGNQTADYLMYDLVGKENRNFLEIGMRYRQISDNRFRWFWEVTAQLNSVKVENADLVVEGNSYTMIDYYGGATYDPTIDQTFIDPMLGGVGFGGCTTLGLSMQINDWAALEPFAQLQYIRIRLSEPYRFKPNYLIGVRINVSDMLFAGKR